MTKPGGRKPNVYRVLDHEWKNKPPKWEYPEGLPPPPPGMDLPPGYVYTGDPLFPVLPCTPPPPKPKRGERRWPPSKKTKRVPFAELIRQEFYPECDEPPPEVLEHIAQMNRPPAYVYTYSRSYAEYLIRKNLQEAMQMLAEVGGRELLDKGVEFGLVQKLDDNTYAWPDLLEDMRFRHLRLHSKSKASVTPIKKKPGD